MPAVLRLGSTGDDVRRLQELLNSRVRPSPNLPLNGNFGPQTDRAVRQFQATRGLGIDGVVGPRTWRALETGAVTPPSAAALTPDGFPDAPWMAIAIGEVGQQEIRGARHNARILEYHATTTLRAATDETAWCSSFVNWCLQQAAITGTNHAGAASWLRWGQRCNSRGGAVTVIYNAAAANSSLSVTGNHVAFLVEETRTHYVLLGGNQSNQVRRSSYPKSAWGLKGYRWPGP